jgi:hypothetical protein
MTEVENHPFDKHYRLMADSDRRHQWVVWLDGGLKSKRRVVNIRITPHES